MKYFRLIALVLVTALIVWSTPVFAGSTGGLSGILTDLSGAPLVGATVSVSSPSQSASRRTDASGAFAFLSLAPDTYVVSIEKTGYDTLTFGGINVFADQTQRLNYSVPKTLKTIGTVRGRSTQELVRAGVVTDTYSINASTQERITGLGGGGSLNQAFSALAAVPGVYVPAGQSGWSQMAGVTIRGGTHSQIGYEFDGVPVNVGINAFPGSNLSTLGQQEIQVYSGSAPLNSEAQGLSGFVNQVIKTGTYPGTASLDLGIGGPSFYHKAAFEFGGATKNRNFSYYVGFLGANQEFRVVDQFNGASQTSRYGHAYDVLPCSGASDPKSMAGCYAATTPGGLGVGPGGFVYAPVNFLSPSSLQDRENIANIHIGIPHRGDGGKDDIQLLYQTGGITSPLYSSANDLGVAPYSYPVGYVYTGQVGAILPATYAANVTKYYFPPAGLRGTIDPNLRDVQQNDQSIFKLQYQHNMGTTAYLRVYGYSLYSDFLFNAPNGASSPASNAFGEPPDYKLWTHTSGYSAELADQISPKHLLLMQASYTHAPSVRDNNTSWANGKTKAFAAAVDSTNPTNGLCYTATGAVASCSTGDGQAAFVSYASALGLAAAPASLAGITCGSGPCAYYAIDSGYRGANNRVVQNTVAASLSDQWRPTDRLTLEYGLRLHQYQINGADTSGGARAFWFNAYNQDYCVNAAPGNTPVAKKSIGLAVTAPCSAANAGSISYTSPGMTNAPANYTFSEIEPRIGATYSLGTNDVIRASFGKYSQPPPTSFQQYDTHQQNLPAYLGARFYKYGYTGSGHNIPPQESFNTDVSLEHGFRGTDVSFKLTPFYRTTRNELTEFFIDPINQLTSGLAVGSLRTSGLEFQLRKGSFDRDGLSALVSYTYTNARIKYTTLPGGGSIITPINNDIKTYNAYTSFCAAKPGDARCGTTSAGGNAAACFTTAGAPDPACAAGSIANPYWNAPVQNILDPQGSYWPTDPVVATTGLGVNSYTTPHVATVVLNYRKHGFAITPSLQFQAGQRYGAPEANAGIDPAAGCGALAGSTNGDPRYPYGAVGGAPYDALTCAAALSAIPNIYTSKFDSIGAFTSPSQLLGSLTMSYDLTKRVTFSLVAANIFNQCFGGTAAAWTGVGTPKVCSYQSGEVSRNNAPTGNAYNPGATFEPFAQYPYAPFFGAYTMGVINPNAPFSVYFNAKLKL